MQQQQFIEIIKQPHLMHTTHLADLELIVKEYPFFETAHLLYTKGLHTHQSINYSKQLRKTAIIANSRSVLYELLHHVESNVSEENVIEKVVEEVPSTNSNNIDFIDSEVKKETSSVSITNNDIKVIYVNTVSNSVVIPEKESFIKEAINEEINIVKSIENETDVPVQEFDVDKLNKNIELEISKSIIQSYIETDIIKTPDLNKEEIQEPSSFTDWLKTVQKENHTFQKEIKSDKIPVPENDRIELKKTENDKKSTYFTQNKQIIDKIIESDPGRIKLGTNKFFTPVQDAKQSLLENEHLVTETLAKIYALQGNISKAIRAYEILSLKFPQKSVYFASLIEKLKTNK